ncbi:MAG: hypothetical protein AUJ99_02370 [Caldisericum sp. CG2_30_36_11]|nr:MAG: hypothetical protein AUJ99_02370 [Caldisericum sp. CG2_30_36_11]
MIRRAEGRDLKDFVNLIYFSSGNVLDSALDYKAKAVLEFLFIKPHNLFSFKHTSCIESNNKIAAILLGYDFEENQQDSVNTGLLMVKKLKFSFIKILKNLLKAKRVIGIVREGEFYISNIAVYPEFRGMGLGTELMLHIEKNAIKKKNKSLSLDVEVQNEDAINLYKKLGFKIISDIKILKLRETFKFYRMIKNL